MLDGSTTTLPRRRVSIIIRGFPLDIWHPMYFRQATTGIGAMVGMVPDTMAGGNKLAVKLVIECHNPNLIPPIITLYHNDKQTVYEVIVEGRGLLGEGQLAPPTPHLLEGVIKGRPCNLNMTSYSTLLHIYRQQRALRCPSQIPDPNRRGASAAGISMFKQRSTVDYGVPCSCTRKMQKGTATAPILGQIRIAWSPRATIKSQEYPYPRRPQCFT